MRKWYQGNGTEDWYGTGIPPAWRKAVAALGAPAEARKYERTGK